MANKIKYATDEKELLSIALPNETTSYKVVSHEQIISETKEALIQCGFKVTNEQYLKGNNGNQATGIYTLGNINDKDMELSIAWQNSYDKTVRLKYAIGANVMVCSNGSVYGDMDFFSKKHTGGVKDLINKNIAMYIDNAEDIFNQMIADKEKLKLRSLTRRNCAEILGRMYAEEDLITETQIAVIKREIISPTFEYNADDSAWELYNHVTHSLKNTRPNKWLETHKNVYSFFNEEFK